MNIQAAAPAIVDLAEMSDIDNTIPIEAWNTVLFEKFCRFRYVLSQGLAGHSEEFFRRKSYPAGARVLDVGCGFGDTTRSIAAQVGPGGEAIGVDCAQNFIDSATRGAADAAIKNTSFFVADAQGDDLWHHVFLSAGTGAAEHPARARARRRAVDDRLAAARRQSVGA